LAARYPLPEQHRRFIHWATSPNWLEQEVLRLGVDVSRAQSCHAPSGVNLPHVLSSRDLIEGAELSGASTAREE
jgi:hypothetical protein